MVLLETLLKDILDPIDPILSKELQIDPTIDTSEADPEGLSWDELEAFVGSDAEKIGKVIYGTLPPEPGIDEPQPTEQEELVGLEALPVTLESIIYEVVLGAQLVDSIVGKSDGKLVKKGTKNGAWRIALTNIKYKNEIDNIIMSALKKAKAKVTKVVPPNSGPDAASGRYNTYIFGTGGGIIKAVFAAGKNEGQRYEQMFKKSLMSRQGKIYTDIINAVKTFYGVSPSSIKAIKDKGGASRVVRPFKTTLTDEGAIISDVDIVCSAPIKQLNNSYIIPVSIKNESGDTFANKGYSDGFAIRMDKDGKEVVVATPSQKVAGVEAFLLALGVDKTRSAQGWTDFIHGMKGGDVNTLLDPTTTPTYDAAAIKNILAAQLGFGYVYVRATSHGLKIVDLSSASKALNVVGEITGVVLRYPYFRKKSGTRSKQLTAVISTSKNKFTVELRHTHGGIIPNQLNVKLA